MEKGVGYSYQKFREQKKKFVNSEECIKNVPLDELWLNIFVFYYKLYYGNI